MIHLGLFTVVTTLMLSGLMIQATATKTVESAQRDVGAIVSMAFDIDGYVEKQNIQSEAVGQSGGQLDADATVLNLDDLEALCADSIAMSCNYASETGAFPTNSMQLFDPSGKPVDDGDLSAALFQVEGVRNLEGVSAFRNGDARIIDGVGLSPESGDQEIVIDKRLAEQNALAVGDSVQLFVGQLARDGGMLDDTPHEFTIAGIYESGLPDAPPGSPPVMQPANQIYASLGAVGVLLGADGDAVKQATFTLADPDDVKLLGEKAAEVGIDTDVFPLILNDKQYRQLVGPIEQTAAFATVIVWASLAAGCIILGLVVTSSLRSRRREVGVLLSLGESKPRVLGQQFLELVTCAVVSVAIAVGVGQLVAPVIGSVFLSSQVAAAQSGPSQAEQDYGDINGGATQVERVDPIDELSISLDPAAIGLVGGAAVGITAVSIALPGIRLARQHPRDILTTGV